MKNAVVLWTGGKDSCLALHLAREKGLNIVALVTFVPSGNIEFAAHPQSRIKQQARDMKLDIHFIEIIEPYKFFYVKALKWLKESLQISIVITGDIDLVGGYSNWIEECCRGLAIETYRPLWQEPREWIMDQILAHAIEAEITFINHPLFPKEWLHRIIDEQLLKEMKILCEFTGIDLCGENGEYHTMVLSGLLTELCHFKQTGFNI